MPYPAATVRAFTRDSAAIRGECGTMSTVASSKRHNLREVQLAVKVGKGLASPLRISEWPLDSR